jgi:hypothetical protein
MGTRYVIRLAKHRIGHHTTTIPTGLVRASILVRIARTAIVGRRPSRVIQKGIANLARVIGIGRSCGYAIHIWAVGNQTKPGFWIVTLVVTRNAVVVGAKHRSWRIARDRGPGTHTALALATAAPD